ncbi:hypothetical protein ABEV54_02355 [Peribacillus psychrosaccharolyticus]|uniref:hypothetical protein n=1 Tax=Peribacillus psychrosaccharolyticus TaxID=1407 RepID=UPI003D292FBD
MRHLLESNLDFQTSVKKDTHFHKTKRPLNLCCGLLCRFPATTWCEIAGFMCGMANSCALQSFLVRNKPIYVRKHLQAQENVSRSRGLLKMGHLLESKLDFQTLVKKDTHFHKTKPPLILPAGLFAASQRRLGAKSQGLCALGAHFCAEWLIRVRFSHFWCGTSLSMCGSISRLLKMFQDPGVVENASFTRI